MSYDPRDGLERAWRGRVWLHPPAASADAFAARLVDSYEAGDVTAAIALLDAHVADLRRFADHPLCIVDHAIRSETRRAYAFAYLGPDPGGFADRFDAFGAVVARLVPSEAPSTLRGSLKL